MSHTIKLHTLLLFLLIFLASSAATKTFDEERFVFDMDKSELKSNEGFLLIHLRNYEFVSRLVFQGEKDKVRFKGIYSGNNFGVVKVKAGHYYPLLLRFSYSGGYRDYRPDKEEYGFEVKAGKLNYPGSWISDLSRSGLTLYSINKTTTIADKLQQDLPQLAASYKLNYTGRYPDPYLGYLEKIKEKKTQLGILAGKPQALGMDSVLTDYSEGNIEVFNKAEGTKEIEEKYPSLKAYYDVPANGMSVLNPAGTHLLRVTYKNDLEYVEVLHLKTNKSYRLFGGEIGRAASIENLKWLSNSSFIFRVNEKYGYSNLVAHLSLDAEEAITNVDFIDLPARGYLIDILIDDPEHILFSYYPNSHRADGVYRINITDQEKLNQSIKKSFYYNKKFMSAEYWMTDSKGQLRFAANYNPKNKTIEYWFLEDKPDSDWKMIKAFTKDDDPLFPEALTSDNESFFVITDQHSDTNGVYRYSTKDFSLQETVFEDENINVISIIFDGESSQVVGVRHLREGKDQATYIDTQNNVWLQELQKKHPDSTFYLTQKNKQTNSALLFESNVQSKGAFYLYHIDRDELRKLYDVSPQYEQLEKGTMHALKTTTADGLTIESYLMMPNHTKKAPLIVMPHGGPIGVRDDASNDETQHFFAQHGFATLKVNFRGSGGFGKKFKDMGKMEWGKKIELDINQVVEQVISQFPINENSICAVGSSYGGYSSLMLTILFPDRYKCAVSSAGVTDIPLLFTSSDMSHREASIEYLKTYAGNPEEQLVEMMSRSPVYLADKVVNPIMLIHGFKDLRVSLEHSLRFQEIMHELGTPVDLLVLGDEFHSLRNIESRMKHTEAVLDFVKQNLDP